MSPRLKTYSSLETLRKDIISCRLCPRLVEYRENVLPKKAFINEPHWRKPVPGYGDPNAWLMITGLAPAAEGGNRTGRIFTGDKTSQFLAKALYDTGFANQPVSESKEDGLELSGCYLTAAVKCLPPQHRPTSEEILNCNCYYQNELRLLRNLSHVLVLGKVAFDAFVLATQARARAWAGGTSKPIQFAHGAHYQIEGLPMLYASYHPSPRNTNTGTLTEKMFQELLSKIIKEHRLEYD